MLAYLLNLFKKKIKVASRMLVIPSMAEWLLNDNLLFSFDSFHIFKTFTCPTKLIIWIAGGCRCMSPVFCCLHHCVGFSPDLTWSASNWGHQAAAVPPGVAYYYDASPHAPAAAAASWCCLFGQSGTDKQMSTSKNTKATSVHYQRYVGAQTLAESDNYIVPWSREGAS